MLAIQSRAGHGNCRRIVDVSVGEANLINTSLNNSLTINFKMTSTLNCLSARSAKAREIPLRMEKSLSHVIATASSVRFNKSSCNSRMLM